MNNHTQHKPPKHTRARATAAVLAGLYCATLLTACQSVKPITIQATDTRTNQPASGALVRVTMLDTGFVALPLTPETIAEIRAATRTRTTIYADAQGLAELAFLTDRPALIEINPSPIRAAPPAPNQTLNARFLYLPAPPRLIPIESADAPPQSITAVLNPR